VKFRQYANFYSLSITVVLAIALVLASLVASNKSSASSTTDSHDTFQQTDSTKEDHGVENFISDSIQRIESEHTK
jgi:hypothetical protein